MLAQPVPAHVPGDYARTHRVCSVTESGQWGNCSNVTDTLRISRDLAVEAKLFFANGHSCSFEGRGRYVRDRLIAADDKDECRLVLFFIGKRVHTVTQGACHQWCGMRGTLDQAILGKRNDKR